MSQLPPTPDPREPASSIESRKIPLVRLAGGLGIAACVIGMAISLTLCAGFSGVLILSIVPLALAIAGLILSFIGPNVQKSLHVPDATVLASILVNLLGIAGAGILIWVWRL